MTILAVAAVAAAGCGGGDDTKAGGGAAATGQAGPHPLPAAGPVIASVGDMRKWSTPSRPIYWAGPRPGTRYEVTRQKGTTVVRYLRPGIPVRDQNGKVLFITSFQGPHAFSALERSAKDPGNASFRLPNKGLAVHPKHREDVVFFSYPGSHTQVQVYLPESGAARRLIEAGRVRPIS